MSTRLRGVTTTTFPASTNQNAVIYDTGSSALKVSDGTNWNLYSQGQIANTLTGSVGANTVPNGTTVVDTQRGLMVSNGTVWLVSAGLDDTEPLVKINGNTSCFQIAPRGNAASVSAGGVTPAASALYLIPFVASSGAGIFGTNGITKISYSVKTLDAAGAALVGIYTSDASSGEGLLPKTLQAHTTTAETANGLVQWSGAPIYGATRGQVYWLAYLRTAGAAVLNSLAADGPGLLGTVAPGGVFQLVDALLVTGTFASLPATLDISSTGTATTYKGSTAVPFFAVSY